MIKEPDRELDCIRREVVDLARRWEVYELIDLKPISTLDLISLIAESHKKERREHADLLRLMQIANL